MPHRDIFVLTELKKVINSEYSRAAHFASQKKALFTGAGQFQMRWYELGQSLAGNPLTSLEWDLCKGELA